MFEPDDFDELEEEVTADMCQHCDGTGEMLEVDEQCRIRRVACPKCEGSGQV